MKLLVLLPSLLLAVTLGTASAAPAGFFVDIGKIKCKGDIKLKLDAGCGEFGCTWGSDIIVTGEGRLVCPEDGSTRECSF
jgi:hypothetical protein